MLASSMPFSEALRSALDNLGSHKLRSALTMLGMMFGVGAVIAMLSIGAGAERQALAIIDRMGLRNIVVRAKELKAADIEEVRKKSIGVSLRDAEAIREAVTGAARVLPRVQIRPFAVRSAWGKSEATVYGVSTEQREVVPIVLDEGRFFDASEEQKHAQVCVLGAATRRELFGVSKALGQVAKVNDLWCEVIGVLAPESVGASSVQGAAVSSTGREIHVPVTTALRKFEHDPKAAPLHEILVQLEPGVASDVAAAAIDGLLRRLHGGQSDYEIIVPEALLEQSRKTQDLFNLVMGCIASISLLVGGIGIMNIMLASVLELTREIGIRRAVGARRRDIRFQFLVASFTISVLGGGAGVLFGVVIARVVAAYAGWPTVVTPGSVLLSTGVSVLVGLLSGLFPAMRAASLNPIEALRYE
jgi:putative ABC transport system permease protein